MIEQNASSFLIRSQRSVVQHCRRLLAGQGLPEDEERRLRALLATAEAELEKLAPEFASADTPRAA